MKPRLALIGPGRVGQAVTARLRGCGYPIAAVVGRDLQRTRAAAEFIGAELMATTDIRRCASAQLILLAVGDDQIATVARKLFANAAPGSDCTIIHFSGLHPAQVMRTENCRSALLSLHPLQTFASAASGLERLPGSYCAIEGDATAYPLGRQIAADLGCNAFTIASSDKALYHAAACMAANFVTTLLDASAGLLAACGDGGIALAVMRPLVEAALNNTLEMGGEQALTGPIVRGDSTTVASHLDALKQRQPQLLDIYIQLASQTVELAQRSRRLDSERSASIKALLGNFKQAE